MGRQYLWESQIGGSGAPLTLPAKPAVRSWLRRIASRRIDDNGQGIGPEENQVHPPSGRMDAWPIRLNARQEARWDS